LFGPIFQREFLTVPRRARHYATRAAYYGALWVVAVTAWLATLGVGRSATLGETARFGPLLFQLLTFLQLALFLFFPALSSASAVALEKDRRTFLLLLMTELLDYEIVLGKMLGSLLPMVLLWIGTFPVMMFLVLLGGVSVGQVIQAMVVLAATGLAAGSLGALIALWRERTFQSLALTVLLLVLYLAVAQGLPLVEPSVAPYQPYFDPFAALLAVQQPAHQLDAGLPVAYGFALVMLGLSLVLQGYGIVMLRVWNPSGEPIQQRERPEDHADVEEAVGARATGRVSVHAAPGRAREVWENPILWREVRTRAYGRRPLLIKIAYFIVLGLICWSALSPVFDGAKIPFLAAYGLIPVGVLSLLLVTAQAVTAITSERDTGALDLLLVTDLSPKEFIFGKILGIVWNTKEYLLPPLILAGIYGWYGYLATPPAKYAVLLGPRMNATAFVCVVGVAVVLLAFAMLLGIHVALRHQNSRVAVLNALSTIFFLSVGTLICIALIVINGQFEYQWTSFLFFLIAGVGGLWWVLNSGRPSAALTWASWFCPLGVLYSIMTILVAKPGTQESGDPVIPFLVMSGAFGFAISAMLVPLLSEFDVALGRTSGGAD
jgi:ABC-type transport system involved in multi-copper enzyme maturation permease subunit